jgi:hypothetical protein
LKPAPGGTSTALLPVTSTSTDVSATFSVDATPGGTGAYLSLLGRRLSSGNDYRVKLRLTTDKLVTVSLVKVVGGSETALTGAVNAPGVSSAPGSKVSVRLQVAGTGTTTLRARVWQASAPEPSTGTRTATDTSTALQGAGSFGVSDYLSSGSAVAPVVSVSALAAQPAP